jgi:hypothetical protein
MFDDRGENGLQIAGVDQVALRLDGFGVHLRIPICSRWGH